MKICSIVIFILFFGIQSTFAEAPKAPIKIKMALNWVPEPEFGGLYAAKLNKLYEKSGMDVELISGGAGSPTVQMLASRQVEFAVTSGNELLIARSKGADLVAVYNIYETSPLCLMAHQSRKAKSIADILNGGTIAIQKGQTFYDFLDKKIGFSKIKVVPYSGGVSQFLRDPMFVQQAFITAEPILARRQGADPQTFLLADIGYNPYVAVIATTGDYLKNHEETTKRFVAAVREGWSLYQKNPKTTNEYMATLNKTMDLQTFNEGAKAQRLLVQKNSASTLGTMTENQWAESAKQLLEFKVITQPVDSKSAFKNF